MSSLTLYAQKKWLDHLLGLASWTMPTTAYLGLFTTSPGETGSLAGEVSGGSYARVAITAKMAATVLGTGVAVNNATIGFATPSADWGTVAYWAVMDASSSGNVLLYGTLQTAFVVSNGDVAPSFAVGDFSVTAPSTDAGYITQYAAKKLLDHTLGLAAWTMPTTVYLALFSSDPGATGSLAGEIATGGYGRQNLTARMDTAVLATGIATSNDAVQFPDPTADYSVTHFGVADAITAGNLLMRFSRGSTLSVVDGGNPVKFTAGRIALQAA